LPPIDNHYHHCRSTIYPYVSWVWQKINNSAKMLIVRDKTFSDNFIIAFF
jgi:hypothetical protein